MVQKKSNTLVLDYDKRSAQRLNQRKKRRKRRTALYITGCILFLCVAAVAALLILYSDTHIAYAVELGDPVPSAQVFSISGNSSVEYLTDLSTIDVTKTGSNWIHISVDGNDRLVNLVVKDTVAPVAQPVELTISINDTITPDKLITGLADRDKVNIQWQREPEFGKAGDYSVVLTLRDMSGNTSTVTSTLHIRAVVDTLEFEAGGNPPTLEDFLVDKSLNATMLTDISSLPLAIPGQYDVSIEVNGVTYTSVLSVVDTTNPVITAKLVHIKPGAQAKPEDFIASAEDATTLSYSYKTEPDFTKTGFQDAVVVATDLGGNSAEAKASLLISNVAPITVEIRDTPLAAAEFAEAAGKASASLASEMIPNMLGEFDVEVIIDGQRNITRVTVVDTTPPKAEPADVNWYLAHPLAPEKFVSNAFDYTQIAYSFKQEPDWNSQSAQSVTVVLTDAAGNSSECTSTLKLTPDTEAPVLYDVKDRYVYIGKAVAYFADVFAEDNCDAEVDLQVDNSKVNINAAGTYEVTYIATDSSGNTTRQSCNFTFVEQTVSDEKLHEAAQQVLSEITTSDMSIGKKAYAIFKYVNTHIKYNGISNKKDYNFEAYRGITEGRGDCFTFYATARCLLNEIGAQTMCVERWGSKTKNTEHYWVLANLGTGWYHFDAINVGPRNFDCFMKTDKELLGRGPNWWSFNRDLYPKTPAESFKLE